MTTLSFDESELLETPEEAAQQAERLGRLAEMPDATISFRDIPVITDFSGFLTV